MIAPPDPLRILHLHGSPAADDAAARVVQLINAFGRGCAHAIVRGNAGTIDARPAIDRGITVDHAEDFPALAGRPTPGHLQRLARAMQGYDMVLTYGYGAMSAAMAHTMCGGYLPLPPLVHHEDTAGSLKPLLNWYRRIALGRAAALVVPSRRLETIAIASWHQPHWRVKRIAPGICTAACAVKPRRDALPRVIKRPREFWLGTHAQPGPADQLTRLVRALAVLPPSWQLVILGDRADRDAIRDEALRLDLGHRVHWPGVVAEPDQVIGLFDVFVPALDHASSTPIIQAMAAGLPVAGTADGDVAALLAPENRPFIVDSGDVPGLATALRTLAEAPALRARVGAANRARALADYDESTMVLAYRAVYGAALGRKSFPG